MQETARRHGVIISTLDRLRYGENAAVLNGIAGKPTIPLSAGVFHVPALKQSHRAAGRFPSEKPIIHNKETSARVERGRLFLTKLLLITSSLALESCPLTHDRIKNPFPDP